MILLLIEERRGLKIVGRDDPLRPVIVMAARSTVMRYYEPAGPQGAQDALGERQAVPGIIVSGVGAVLELV